MPEATETRHHKAAEPDPIETYLDGELSAVEARRFERRLASDPELAAEVDLARSIRAGLPGLRRRCPPEVLERVEAATVRAGPWSRLRATLGRAPASWQPALAALVLLTAAWWLLPAGGLLTGFKTPPAERQGLTAVTPTPRAAEPHATPPSPLPATSSPEVEEARREVELAFAYLGKLGRTAEDSVRQLAVARLAPGADDAS